MSNMEVREAHFRRVSDYRGQPEAEVEVLTGDPQTRRLLAYFTPASNGSYSLVRLLANNADYEVDWYDNDMHAAFEDVTSSAGADGQADFAAQILAYDGVKQAIDRNLRS